MHIYLLTLNHFGQHCLNAPKARARIIIASSPCQARKLAAENDPDNAWAWLNESPEGTDWPTSDIMRISDAIRHRRPQVLVCGYDPHYPKLDYTGKMKTRRRVRKSRASP